MGKPIIWKKQENQAKSNPTSRVIMKIKNEKKTRETVKKKREVGN